MRLLHKRSRNVHMFRSISLAAVLAVVLVLGVFVRPSAAATPTFKQARGNEVSTGTTNNVAFTSANVAGDLIVVHVLWSNTSGVTVTDSRGNTYTAATARSTWSSSWSEQIFYAKNVAAGANTVTATFATSVSSFGIVQVHEYAGLDKVNPFEAASSGVGTGTTMNSGTLTTTNTSDLLFAGGGSLGTMNAPPTGWTARLNSSGNRSMDKNVTAAGSYSLSTTHSGGAWDLQLVAFRADPGTDTTAPTAPANLAATAVSTAQINLTWTASTDNVGVTAYQVERCLGASCTNFALVATVATPSYNNTGLTAGTLYRYRVRAMDAANNLSAYSAIAQAITQSTPDTTPPSVPANLAATAVSGAQINLGWSASTDNVAVSGYVVFRNGTQIATPTTTSYQDSGLTAGTTYNYTVAARDAAGNTSAQSAVVSASTFVADTTPPTVSMTAPTPGTVVSGTIPVSANASDNQGGTGVTNVQFFVDGTTPIGADTTQPYSINWDTTTVSNGVHSVSAKATDGAGNATSTSSSMTVTVSNSAPPPSAGLLVGYGFGEGTGTTTADLSGNGNTATLQNSPAWVAGKNGGGLRFDKVNDFMSIAQSPTLDITGTHFTFSTWINPTGGGDQELFGKFWATNMTPPYYQYAVELDGGTIPHFYVGTTGGLNGGTMGGSLAVGSWSHLAITYDGSLVRFYVNGNLISTQGLTSPITSHNSYMNIGADANTSQFFGGTLDDFRIYGRTLSQAEIQSDMSTPLLPPANDPTAPSVSITSPANSSVVNGSYLLQADATDDVGIKNVQFYVNGALTGPEDTDAPYAATWDTRVVPNGAYTITARATDTDNKTTMSAPINVTVANSDYFQNQRLITNLSLPTALKFMPDGRMLISELRGTIKVVPPPFTTANATPALQLTNLPTVSLVQQGIFDFALDPNLATNHYIYIFYSSNNNDGKGYDRLSRFTFNADLNTIDRNSETVLYGDPEVAADEHHGGAVAFASDGKIFFTTGDHFQGSPAQDLDKPRGKLMHINPDGTGPADNPYFNGNPNAVRSKVYAYGLRNPFRMSYDSVTNKVYIGDVGGNIDTSVEDLFAGAPGANYGWPCREASCGFPITAPIYSYPHNASSASITAGFMYRGSQFPASMQGNFFFGDYAQHWIKRLTFDAIGNVNGVFDFEPVDGNTRDHPAGDVVYITPAPDGSLYYIDLGYSDVTGNYGQSTVHQIRYLQTNQAPVAMFTASPTTGPQPLNVTFSSTGSMDPEGQPITYSWDFGDGATSTAANPAHTYTAAGNYLVRLSVSDGVNSSFSTPQTIVVGNAPTATILTPTNGITFKAGDVISFSGDATDPEDGSLPASAYSWQINFWHNGSASDTVCPNTTTNCHIHPGMTLNGAKNGTFTIPTSGGEDYDGLTRWGITLTVTDSNGLKDTKTVVIWPQKVNLTFNAVPAGLNIALNGTQYSAPHVHQALIGYNYTLDAPNQTMGGTNYTFSSWSDGGAQTHNLLVPATDQTYTATYTSATNSTGAAAAWGFNETSGTTAGDASGNNNVATLLNGLTFAPGKNGNGLSFDGTNDYLSVPNSSSVDISGTTLTLSMWLKPSGTGGDQLLLGKHWGTTMTSPYYQYGIELQNNGVKPVFFVGTASGFQSVTMSTNLSTTQWSHLAIVYNGSTVQFYVNGLLVNSGAMTAPITARGNPLRIGADASTSQFYKGMLDDVRIYNRAQSAVEVQADMSTGL